MDRLIATNSVPFANRDVAPLTGTPQYATDGDPATSTPPTIWPAWAYNMLQDEIMAVILAAGLTPDNTNWGQLLQAISNGFLQGHGKCRLSVASSTQLDLMPYNGRRLIVNGAGYTIPKAGISIANTGLSPSTLYYVYAFVSSGALALELSTTANATDASAANYGIEIKTGDSTRTLVGMIYTGTGSPGPFLDAPATRFCANWFNRTTRDVTGAELSGVVTGSTVMVELSAAARAEFLCWGDDAVAFGAVGSISNSTVNTGAAICVGVDGVTAGGAGNMVSYIANFTAISAGLVNVTLDTGFHYATVMGTTSFGGVGSFQGAVSGIIKG